MALIVIQQGHVPRTTGATGAKGEQAYAIAAAEATAIELRKIGHIPRVIPADPSMDSAYRGDMFFALHWDGNTSPTVSGASVGWQTPEGNHVGRTWKRHYAANGWTRSFKPDNYTPNLRGYYGVREAVAQGNKYAIITEAGFCTNAHDLAMMSPRLTAISIAATVVDIMGASCPPSTPPPGIVPYPGQVTLGSRGEAVKVWQRMFNPGSNLVVDGIFGQKTLDAVVHWQRAYGLTVDGIAGPATWHSLMLHRRV